MGEEPLHLTRRSLAGVVVVEVTGRVNDEERSALGRGIEESEEPDVVIDLSRLETDDPIPVLSVLVKASAGLAQRQQRLRVVASDPLRALIDFVGYTRLLRCAEDVESAVRETRREPRNPLP